MLHHPLQRIAPALLTLSILATVGLPTAASANSLQPSNSGTVPQVTTPSLSPASAWLRFSRVAYSIGDCVQVVLTAPGGSSPAVTLATHLSRDSESVQLTSTAPGVFSSTCLPVQLGSGQSRDGILEVQPGDFIAATATQSGQVIAARLASVHGGLSIGRFQPVVDPTILSGAELTDTLPSTDVHLRPAAVRDSSGVQAGFVADEVIVKEARSGDLAAFLSRRGGREVGRVSMPGPSAGGAPEIYHLVQVDPAQFQTADFAYLQEQLTSDSGSYTFSSRDAEALSAMIVEEMAGGTLIFPDLTLTEDATPVSNEGLNSSGNTPVANDFFQSNWYNPLDNTTRADVHAGEAMAMLQLIDQDTRPRVPTAILDGGFAGPSAWGGFQSADWGNGGFNSIPQCTVFSNANCAPGIASGANLMQCSGGPCPWHGTSMYSVAGAPLDNRYGSAGIGSASVAPILLKLNASVFSMALGISQATTMGARVVNMSFSMPCKPFLGWNLCDPTTNDSLQALLGWSCWMLLNIDPVLSTIGCDAVGRWLDMLSDFPALQNAIDNAETAGVVLVAAAGNNNEDVNDVKMIPCTLGHVVCVGGLAPGSAAPVAASQPNGGFNSAHGASVNIWAPGVSLQSMPDPASDPTGAKNNPNNVGGTSPATAFISGLVADVRSIAPALSPAQVRSLVFNATCQTAHLARLDGTGCAASPDPEVAGAGYVDALQTIRSARAFASKPTLSRCTGGWGADEQGTPNDVAVNATNIGRVRALPVNSISFQGNGDLAIHELTLLQLSVPDWYEFSFNRQSGDPAGLHVEVDVPVQDSAAGSLSINLFEEGATKGVYKAIPLLLSQPSSVTGTATAWAIMSTNRTYLIQVNTTSNPQIDDNCYSGVTVKTGDVAPEPCSVFNPLACFL